MTRTTLRLTAQTGLLFVLIACATAEGGDDPVGSGPGAGSGGVVNGGDGDGSGGVVIGTTGGTSSGTGGTSTGLGGAGAETGGASSATGGVAATGGTTAGAGGTTFDGACADLQPISAVDAQGFIGVYTCMIAQSGCSGATLMEPAVFECNDSHVGNCTSQDPTGGSSWTFLGMCSEFGMGGATN